jgi:hypothetical protein
MDTTNKLIIIAIIISMSAIVYLNWIYEKESFASVPSGIIPKPTITPDPVSTIDDNNEETREIKKDMEEKPIIQQPQEIKQEKQCSNESLNETHKRGKEYKKPYEINCAEKEGLDSEEEYDPFLFYKEKYRAMPLIMEDEKIRGYNVSEYSGSARLNDIGSIPIQKDRVFPVPHNFTFKNSPAIK